MVSAVGLHVGKSRSVVSNAFFVVAQATYSDISSPSCPFYRFSCHQVMILACRGQSRILDCNGVNHEDEAAKVFLTFHTRLRLLGY